MAFPVAEPKPLSFTANPATSSSVGINLPPTTLATIASYHNHSWAMGTFWGTLHEVSGRGDPASEGAKKEKSRKIGGTLVPTYDS